VREHDLPHGLLSQPAYLNSPVRHVSKGLGGVRQRLDGAGESEFRFPVMEELRAQGGTDYVAMALPFSDGQINTMTLTSDHGEGFSTADLGSVCQCVFGLSRFYETMTLRQNMRTLLTTYLGMRSGTRVLNGETRRGAGEEITAAILTCDLRHSTQLTASLPRLAYLELLNDFFETVVDPILSRSGEVLKFIGDGVLAIFPVDGDPGAACGLARDAALEIIARLAETENPRCAAPLACMWAR
jgi:adenylate cyclase